MHISFRCPACHKKLKAADRKAGQNSTCPNCGGRITVPGKPALSDGQQQELVDWLDRQESVRTSIAEPTLLSTIRPDNSRDIDGDIEDVEVADNLEGCPDCGTRVSRRAHMCPKCGCPLEAREDEMREKALRSEDMTNAAIFTLVLYFLLWLPGLIANIVLLLKAERIEREFGDSPKGKGCLWSLFWWFFVAPLIVFVVLMIVLLAMRR